MIPGDTVKEWGSQTRKVRKPVKQVMTTLNTWGSVSLRNLLTDSVELTSELSH